MSVQPMAPVTDSPNPWEAYRLVWKRRRILWRCLRSRHALAPVVNRTKSLSQDDILAFSVIRNESLRLPWFLKHYRSLGVNHFLIVDNDSADGSFEYLADQPDVSLWRTSAGYRDARFGLDWIGWLLLRYGHRRWCLSVDADELLVYAGCDTTDLRSLTSELDEDGRVAFGALMLDLYPKGPIGDGAYDPETDPVGLLSWFDPGPWRIERQVPMRNLWLRGGARERGFFADRPDHGPTLNKLPLVRWNRRWAYVNSTHSALPWRLNRAYNGPGDTNPAGVLLHTKFLPDVVERAAEDVERRQHFHDPDRMRSYYDDVGKAPILWSEASVKYEGWPTLVEHGLMPDRAKP